MEYVSTRGSAPTLDFEGVTLAGLANDGGLYLPREWPRLTEAQIRDLRGLPYPALAAEIMRPFVAGSLTDDELDGLCNTVYGDFGHAAVTPLVQMDESQWLLELFHGPTLAFKDVALQMLGHLFETFLARRDARLTIVGATSGDTGSAAINAVAGRDRTEIFMLHPKGRVSEVQRRQMTTVRAPNVHNIAIEGSFDDAQRHVKAMFSDPEVNGPLNLGAVNSINWARLMAQVVYYFYSALQLGAPDRTVAYSVPTGNFGDVFAGYVAAQMGLPIERLIVATNVNDILHRALSDGDYSAGTTTPTITPSMDIQVSSNFERLLFDLTDSGEGRDGAAMAEQMRGFEASKAMQLTNSQREGAAKLFTSMRADQTETARALQWAQRNANQVIDPHTGVGLHASLAAAETGLIAKGVPIVTLATAHPAKFSDAVERAIGVRPPLPSRVGDLFGREEHFVELAGDYETSRSFVLENAASPAA
ncbi:threonine synthase [uncultured Erythrobacter sp.]|uniref:threonine synthase n=1 Tax=uncultured Erythrobacter sp. TaxID=263913 RepID=UPI00261A04C9|nr:threonine synthase [uncultured Erythrobacter sp.]